MKYPKIPLAQTVVQLCKAKHIKHIIISPGSRNAPLTIGFTNDPYFECYSIVDERCAAFFALGIAQQLDKPVAVVCTSGSALLNYYPAIAEAFYSDIPMVVLSADRPKHLIGVGDGQTINQKNVFEQHILCSANLKLDIKEDEDLDRIEELPIFKNMEHKLETLLGLKQSVQIFNEEAINKAINSAILEKGPVHINIPFDEPLYDMVDALLVNPENINAAKKQMYIDESVLESCITDWNAANKKMVLIGVNQPNDVSQEWLDTLANDESVIVFTETTSNVHHSDFFPSIDKIIAPLENDDFKKLQPEILLTFGGLIVSKKIKAFLRNYKPEQHWHIDLKKANDTFFSLSQVIETTPDYFFSKFLPRVKTEHDDYKSYWNVIKASRQIRHQEYLDTIAFSDLKAFGKILETIPDHTVLQLSNSSTVRYAQLFDINKTLQVFCNRGTSGIDGSTSTALGCAVVNHNRTTLVTGDLSFIYDSNGLWNNHIPKSFRVIIINNQGGGIFRILPGHKNTENFDTFFETKHNLTAEHLSKMYGFEYEAVSEETSLEQALKSFYKMSDRPKILEIFTPRTVNDALLLEYFDFLR